MSIYLRLLIRLIGPERQDSNVLDLESVELTHYKLSRDKGGSLGLTNSSDTGLTGLPIATGSAQPRDLETILLEQLIGEINDLFAGSGLDDDHQLNAVSSVYRVAKNNPDLKAIAVHNSKIDFEQSPKISSLVDEIRYAVDLNSQKALGWLSSPNALGSLLRVLFRLGLYEDLRTQKTE